MSGPRVLVIDDDHDLALLTQLLLEQQGYDVDVAFDARRGLALALSDVPQLILLDYSLPGKSGLALLADMRALPELASIPIIMITGYGVTEIVTQAVRQHVSDFLVKPFDIQMLVDRVAKWVAPPEPRAVSAASAEAD